MSLRPEIAAQQYCYLTTRGRRSGNPHTIEIWFGLVEDVLYLLAGAGERSDWVRNLQNDPKVQVRLDGRTYMGSARVVSDPMEDQTARQLLVGKYQPGHDSDLGGWGKTALPVAVDLSLEA